MPDVDKWGYEQEYDPEENDPHCICGLPVSHWAAYCGPSCELADELGTVAPDYADFIAKNTGVWVQISNKDCSDTFAYIKELDLRIDHINEWLEILDKKLGKRRKKA